MMGAEHQRIRNSLLEGLGDDLTGVAPETIYFIESELIEDHLEGSLSSSEAKSFVENFLVTEERKEHLNEIRLLKRFSSDTNKFDAATFDESVATSTGQRSSIVAVLLLAALAAVIFILTYQLFQR